MYKVHSLVWYEECADIEQAILREKQIEKLSSKISGKHSF